MFPAWLSYYHLFSFRFSLDSGNGNTEHVCILSGEERMGRKDEVIMKYDDHEDTGWRPTPQQIKQIKTLLPVVIIGIVVLIALATMIYTVAQDERGVVTRFGKFVRVAQPGLHFKIPFWIETVQKPRVERILKEEFGFRTAKAGIRTTYQKGYEDEALMLCGDLNCAMVEWIVQYKIKDPIEYLFNVRDPRKTIRDVSEAAMRNIVGNSSVDEILTTRRIEVNKEAEQMMQEMIDAYDLGVKIVMVKLQNVNPPQEVKPAFNEVNEAKQDRERIINEALQEYNREVPKAKGEGKRMIEVAQAYAIERTNTAKGEAARFHSVWEEYNKAKDVTRRRIYLETMREILPRAGRKIIIDKSQTGILPLLSLSESALKGGEK